LRLLASAVFFGLAKIFFNYLLAILHERIYTLECTQTVQGGRLMTLTTLTKAISAAAIVMACSFSPYVVAAPATPVTKTNAVTPAATKSKAGLLNLNSANAAELTDKLVGVGPKKAEAIVAWRKANGGFKNPAQLMEVKGIGPSLYERNKAILSIR
jgi:competence protein ComEA